jgi:hypothetical protein
MRSFHASRSARAYDAGTVAMRRALAAAACFSGTLAASFALVCCANLGALTSGEQGGAAESGEAARGPGADGSWCSQQSGSDLVFCDDFDEADGGLLSTWDAEVEEGGGTVQISSRQSVSPPNSFNANFGQPTGGCNSVGLVQQFFPIQTQTKFTFAFDFLTDGTNGLIASMFLGTSYYLAFAVGGQTYYLQQGGMTAGYDASPVSPGQWVRVSFQVSVASGVTATLSLATSPEGSLQTVATQTYGAPPSFSTVEIELGDACHGDDGGRDLYYDNVTFRAD